MNDATPVRRRTLVRKNEISAECEWVLINWRGKRIVDDNKCASLFSSFCASADVSNFYGRIGWRL